MCKEDAVVIDSFLSDSWDISLLFEAEAKLKQKSDVNYIVIWMFIISLSRLKMNSSTLSRSLE